MKLVQAVVVAVVLALLAERAYAVYQWKLKADQSIRFAEATASYLFADTEVKKDGKALSRAALLDLLLSEVLKRNAQQAAVSAGAPSTGSAR